MRKCFFRILFELSTQMPSTIAFAFYYILLLALDNSNCRGLIPGVHSLGESNDRFLPLPVIKTVTPATEYSTVLFRQCADQ